MKTLIFIASMALATPIASEPTPQVKAIRVIACDSTNTFINHSLEDGWVRCFVI